MLIKLEKRCHLHLQQTNDSWRVDETYVKVKGKWKYLYRTLDSADNTLDFVLSAKRDRLAAKRFFCKALKAIHNQLTRLTNVDTVDKGRRTPAPNNLKNAAYPKTVDELEASENLSKYYHLRQNKYFNNLVEQEHRFIKRSIDPSLEFQSFYTTRRIVIDYETKQLMSQRTPPRH